MSPQEIFDKVALHLLTQNAQSLSEAGDCVYRGEDGCKCAAGCLIPDDKYTPDIEGMMVPYLGDKLCEHQEFDILWTDLGVNCNKGRELLRNLQTVHDESKPECWPELLVSTAAHYFLTPDVVTQFGART